MRRQSGEMRGALIISPTGSEEERPSGWSQSRDLGYISSRGHLKPPTASSWSRHSPWDIVDHNLRKNGPYITMQLGSTNWKHRNNRPSHACSLQESSLISCDKHFGIADGSRKNGCYGYAIRFVFPFGIGADLFSVRNRTKAGPGVSSVAREEEQDAAGRRLSKHPSGKTGQGFASTVVAPRCFRLFVGGSRFL